MTNQAPTGVTLRNAYWTKARVIDALRAIADEVKGALPCSDKRYNALKIGKEGWPPARFILGHFHSMGRAWLAAGANPRRVMLNNIKWSDDDKDYLLMHAGSIPLVDIAKRLRRTYGSVKTELNKELHIKARDNQGYLSAAQLAVEYNCSYSRIRKALSSGFIKGQLDKKRNRWQIDYYDIMTSPVAQEILSRPKETHKDTPVDTGNYDKRYGLKRIFVEGRSKRVPVCEATY